MEFIGQIVFDRFCRQLDFIRVDSPFQFGVENGLILTARIVGQPDTKKRVRVECAVLVLSNMYGVPLSIAIGHSEAKFRPPIMNTLMATSGSNNTSSLEQMRREVIKFLGFNNILVGFQVGWALAELQLPISAERVVDLSIEPAFATHKKLGPVYELSSSKCSRLQEAKGSTR